MNEITHPLNRQTQGPPVADLHNALHELLARALILPNDEGVRRELATALQRDLLQQSYGEATGKVVSVFQREHRLKPSGEVDGLTADALNKLLRELRLLDQERPPASRSVTGIVRREDGPLQGARVRATHVSERGAIRLGEDSTNAEGRYTIRYDTPLGVDAIDLQVSAIGEDGRTIVSSEVVPNAKPVETINLTVPNDAPVADRQTIKGAILLEHGMPAKALKLRLYRRDFGGKATRLDETTTSADGRYAFSYDAGSRAASLEVRAVKSDGIEVPVSKPLHDLTVEARAHLNLLTLGSLQPLSAEYRRLVADLTPHVGQIANLAGTREDTGQQDLTVLNRTTGWDARLIALASVAERLALDSDVGLPSEALYGLLRAGLPSDKLLLAQVDPDVVEMAIKKVRDAGVVEMNDAGIAALKTKFTAFANKTRLAMPIPGSRSTYGDLLKSCGLPQDAQDKFAPVYLKHRGDGAQLWEEANKAGLDGKQIRTLQLQGKLAFLAGNSEAMTTRMLSKGLKDPSELVGQDSHSAAVWKSEVFEQAGIPQERRANLTDADLKKLEAVIPATYGGENVEARLGAYAEDMARKVRLSYPTQVLGRLMETDQRYKLPSGHDAAVKLLKNATAQGFRLGLVFRHDATRFGFDALGSGS